MLLDYSITPSALGAARWEIFDCRTAQTIAAGEAPNYRAAQSAALAAIAKRENEPGRSPAWADAAELATLAGLMGLGAVVLYVPGVFLTLAATLTRCVTGCLAGL